MSDSSFFVGPVQPDRLEVARLDPASLQALTFISHYDTSDPLSPAINQHGYQRPPAANRASNIAKYYADKGHGHLIPPIIVSVRLTDSAKIATFRTLLESRDVAGIKSQFGDHVCSIVDGQHRLLGLVKGCEDNADFNPDVPVMLYYGLTFEDEAAFFNTINAEQRKLPKALIETTKGDVTERGAMSHAQLVRRIAFSLCRDDDSVWGPIDSVDQINMTGVRDPQRPVTYEGLRRSTAGMFPAELLERCRGIDEELPTRLAKRFWQAVSEACPSAWHGSPGSRTVINDEGEQHEEPIKYRLKDLVGVASLAKLGKDIIQTHLDSGSEDRLEQLVSKLDQVDWEKREDNPWMKSQAGFAGQKDMYRVLYRLVYEDRRPAALEADRAPAIDTGRRRATSTV